MLSVHLDGYLNVLRVGAADHGRGRTRPDPRGHLGFGLATRERRRVQLRQAGGRRAHLAAREGRAAGRHGERVVADRGDAHGDLGPAPAGAARPAPATRARPVASRSPSRRCRHPSSSVRSARTSASDAFCVELGEHHLLQRLRGRADRAAAGCSRWCAPPTSPTSRHALDVVIPAAFVPAEAAQATERRQQRPLRGVFDEARHRRRVERRPARGRAWSSPTTRRGSRRCATRLASRGVEGASGSARVHPRPTSSARPSSSRQAARDAGASTRSWSPAPVRLRAAPGAAGSRCSTEHAGIVDAIRSDVAWVRAVSDHAARVGSTDARSSP